MKFFILTLLIASWAHSETLDFELTKVFDNQKKIYNFAAKAPSGHHFNVNAPNKVVSGRNKIQLTSATQQLITFNHVTDKVVATLYICDEGNTFCKPIVKKLESEKAVGIQAVETFMAKEKYQGIKLHGFMLNDIDKAFKISKQKNKAILIDFFGIWCPPCNQMDSTVFSSKEFKKLSKNFILLKVDADDPISWNLKSKYQVTGYPTFLFINSKSEELYRLVGSTSKDRFLELMNRVAKFKNKSIEQLEKLADQKDLQVISALAETAIEQKNYSKAQLYFSKAGESFEDDLSFTKLKLINDGQSLKFVDLIQQQIKNRPTSKYTLQRYEMAFDILEKNKKNQELKALRQQYEKFLTSALNDTEFRLGLSLQVADLYALLAENNESLEQAELAKSNYKLAADKLDEIKTEKIDRGFYLDKAYYLYKAGEPAQAHEIYKKLQNLYSSDFTFYFYDADLFVKEKKWDSAELASRSALKFSYGDNKLRVTKQLSMILAELGKKQEALTLIDITLKNQPLPEDKKIRTHQYYKALTDLKEKLLK